MTLSFQPGDRVLIQGLTLYGRDHIDQTGTVTNPNAEWETTYYVVVIPDISDGERMFKPADLELIGNAQAQVGDRVMVRALNLMGTDGVAVGHQGDVIAFTRDGGRDLFRVNVVLPGRPNGLPFGVTELDKVLPVPEYPAATAAVGDYVAVIRTKNHEHEGRVGQVEFIIEPARIGNNVEPRVYGVRVSGVLDCIGATKVAALTEDDVDALQKPTPAPEPEAPTWTAVFGPEVIESDPHEGLDPIRVRALQAAPDLLPHNADALDVIRAAEFLTGPQFLELPTDGGTSAPDLTEDLTVTDVDGDVVRFTASPTPTDGNDAPVAVITQPDTGDAFEVYLSPLAVTQVRDYLAAAARVQAA